MRFAPDDTSEPDNYIELTDTDGTRTVNGDLSIVVGAYENPQRDWFIKDTAKLRKGSAGLFNLARNDKQPKGEGWFDAVPDKPLE